MSFDTKIKVILLDGLEPWQELNVTAFLMSGIAQSGEITGEPYEDADGVRYLPMSQQPIVILTADSEKLKEREGWKSLYIRRSFLPLLMMRITVLQ